MKIKTFIFVLILSILILSCKTISVNIEVLKPSEIELQGNYKTISVINRSLAAKGNRGRNFTEGLFSGEAINQDRKASEYCIQNLVATINDVPKYKSHTADNFTLYGTGIKLIPLELNWDTVQKITDFYSSDLLLVLESFDTDSKTYTDTYSDGDNTERVKGTEILIFANWRLYDPSTKTIIDQFQFNQTYYWETNSSTRRKGEKHPQKRTAAVIAGEFAGYNYASRISPFWATESRLIFHTLNEKMRNAIYHVQKGEWERAYEIWKVLEDHDNKRISAYASHNIAVYFEVSDNIDMAIKSAETAYEKYPNIITYDYLNKLSHRKTEIERLKRQLEE